MRITQFTDYSLRVLIYLGLKEDLATVPEITAAFKTSGHQLVKVVHRLSQEGYLRTYRGKNGGLELAMPPEKIKIGSFIQSFEAMDLLECFDRETNTCPIQGCCQLERALHDAQKAFIQSLNRFTLADFLVPGPLHAERLSRLGLTGPHSLKMKTR